METRERDNFPMRPKIIFMGTPDFATPSLKGLVEHEHHIVAVVTQPDRPSGRGRKITLSPVKRVAVEYGLEVLQPEKASEPQFLEVIRGKAPDILIVVAFGQLLKKDLLEIPRWGVLNIHASLLPKYRGAAPIPWAILKNETKTGVTAMRMDEGLDTGPILVQKETPIEPNETAGKLHDRLAQMGAAVLLETLESLAESRLEERAQIHGEASYAPKIDRTMAFVEWNQSAETLSALIRALDPWPGAFSKLGEKEIKLFSPVVKDEDRMDAVPGRVLGCWQGAVYVETGSGVIGIKELQVSGKRRLPAEDFVRGSSLDQGTVLGR